MGVPLCYPHASGSYLSLEAPAPLRKAPHWPLGAPVTTLSQPLLAAGHCDREGGLYQAAPTTGHCASPPPPGSQQASGSLMTSGPVPTGPVDPVDQSGSRSWDHVDERIIVTPDGDPGC